MLHLQILHLCKRLDVWHDKSTLGGLRVLGIIVSSISVVASGTYFALVVTRGQGKMPARAVGIVFAETNPQREAL